MKLLIIDDDKYFCEIVVKFLEQNGHLCTISNDGKSARELLQKNEFDIIILDMFMHDFSCFEFLKELTRIEPIQKTKVVIYSAMPFSKNGIYCLLESGVTTFVKKDMGLNYLLKTLESLCP